jgi:hypothetical protein
VSAPTIDDRLVVAIARLDSRLHPIAETSRRVGAVADALALPRPSYQQVRVHVHALRARLTTPRLADVALDVAFRVRPPQALLDYVTTGEAPAQRSRQPTADHFP